jgi:hypothetical protein
MNTLDALAGNIPNRIDRTVFPGQSGGTQNQLLTAFKFLGFINDEGKPQPILSAVAVPDPEQRKVALRRLIESKYADLFALNLMKTTPSELAEQMTKSYNVSGDTRLKATRFFLAAAAYLGIPVSPLLLRDKTKLTAGGSTAKNATRKRRTRRIDDADDGLDDDVDLPLPPASGEARSVRLKSGGTLTLSASTKFMALSSADRNFVFGLIDKLEEYETANSPDSGE